MSQTPSSCPCPPYIPATQITPDSVDEIPTQKNTLFTQELRRILFDPVDLVNNHNNGRNYYEQLFSSDSEDDESNEYNESSDMSISESEKSIYSLSDSIHTSRDYYEQLFSSDSEDDEDNESFENAVDDIDAQAAELFTQDSGTRVLLESNVHENAPINDNYSPESSPNSKNSSSDMSISDSETFENKQASTSSNRYDLTAHSSKLLKSTSSDMSISDSDISSEHRNKFRENPSINTTISKKIIFSNLPKSIANAQLNEEDPYSCHTSTSSSSSATSYSSSNISSEASSLGNWLDNKDICGITELLDQSEIDDLLGANEIARNSPTQEVLPKQEIDKIGSFNIRNKYDHDIAAFFMMQEGLSFLTLQEPYAASNPPSSSWNSYKKLELESARITCYETHFQIILFDTWKWGGKIISPFRSEHQGRATSIAFGFGGDQKLGIVSIYASTQECSACEKEDEMPSSSSLNITVRKMVKELYHQFPNICVIIMGDLQETVSTSDRDNIGMYRKDYNSKGILGNFLKTHSSIIREQNHDKNYITRFGEAGGRGIDHILFPNDAKYSSWIQSAKIEREEGAKYFPSDHSYINCSIHRKGSNNNEDSAIKRKFDYRKICNIKLLTSISKSDEIRLSFNKSQFKDCDSFRDQQKLYNQVQKLTNNSSSLTEYYLDEIEERIKFLYKELWHSGIHQKVEGKANKLVKINEKHAAELSHILRKFHTGVKDVMTHLDCVKDTNTNASAGTRRNRLRKEKGFHLHKNSPIHTKLRYLKVASKLKLRLLQQVLYFCKEYRIRKSISDEDVDFNKIDKSWAKILSDSKLEKYASTCYMEISENLLMQEAHVNAIEYENNHSKRKRAKQDKIEKEEQNKANSLRHTSEGLTKLINLWLHESECDQPFHNAMKTQTDSYLFLKEETTNFLEPIKELDIKTMVAGNVEDARNFYSNVEKSINILTNFQNKISKAQYRLKHSYLAYLLDTNNISQFTSKLLHKNRSAPETHSEIWDASIQSFRPCHNEYEELIATSDFHSKWMANSAADEVCAFATLKKDGKLGTRGITLSPDRVITEADIPKLVHNGNRMTKEMKKSFVAAHGKHTANLFRPPTKDREELFYPFYLLNEKGNMNAEESYLPDFFKAIGGIPTKARFDGYHMAVVGRFDSRWQQALLQISKLILLMRYIPTDLKRMERFPIPKPGKHNEYRPISLCHDLYCFVNGICTKHTSAGIEKANFLHDGITAYRPGKGCGSLITIEQCFREDCREHSVPAAQIDEDEEKFFDRIPVEILLAAMRINGFPEQGFLEFKASSMGSKYVDIITKKGVAYAKFVCGLEQGNPDSPTVANLVIKLKHDIWNYISDKAKKIFKKNDSTTMGKYKFNTIDKLDGPVTICKFGYCDDNSKYCFIKNENDLIYLTNYFLQLAGDLSMVTKIGRKGAKSEVQFFNVTAEFALKIDKCFSSAWSFVHDAPIREEVPIKISLKDNELSRFMELSKYSDMEKEEQEKWNRILFPKAHKHLGLTSTLAGNTNETCRKTLGKMSERISQLKLHHMEHKTQKKCFNMLCSTIHSFVPVQANYNSTDLENVDKKFVNIIRKSRGLASSDAKHRIFIPESMGGLGFRSIQDTDITSVAREMEIICNSDAVESEAFRSRIAAILNYSDEELKSCKNHARDSIHKLAKLGIHLRDQSEHEINGILREAEKLPRYQSIGSGRFKGGKRMYMGDGRKKNLDISYGGSVHRILRKLQSVQWDKEEFRKIHAEKVPIDINILSKMRKVAGEKRFRELTSTLSCWEWINTDNLASVPKDKDKWNFIDIKKTLMEKFPDNFWCMSEADIMREAQCILAIGKPPSNSNVPNTPAQGKYDAFWRQVENSASPLFIATDGAHCNTNHCTSFESKNSTESDNKTSASFVICHAQNMDRNYTNDDENHWTNLPCVPLLCRIAHLPLEVGAHQSDIGHGEAFAIMMQEMFLSPSVPRIIVTDSEVTRNVCMKIKDLPSSTKNRSLIRKIMGGISKFITGHLWNSLQLQKHPSQPQKDIEMKSLISKLKGNLNSCLIEARKWTKQESDQNDPQQQKYGPWKSEYFDSCNKRPFLKVNSHQLDELGLQINREARYPKLTPNLCLLNMNHHADISAEWAFQFAEKEKLFHPLTLQNPPSPLRFQFTWEGTYIDKHISAFIQNKIDLERIGRLKSKPTQGLLWRFIDHTVEGWEELKLHKGLIRALFGLSRTHTRGLYKSENYRLGCAHDLNSKTTNACQEIKPSSMSKSTLITRLSQCMWCSDDGKHKLHKGNRRHAILHCDHLTLRQFRDKMANLIEQKLRAFFEKILAITNREHLEQTFMEIEKTCLQLQNSQHGKCITHIHKKEIGYVSGKSLCKKYELTNLIDGLKTPHHFCSELLGIKLQDTAVQTDDAGLGVLNAFWLGLTPIAIQQAILQSINQKNLFKCISDMAACKYYEAELAEEWESIRDLILAKAVGLHRIIGNTSKGIEKHYRKTYHLSKGTFRELKNASNRGDKDMTASPKQQPDTLETTSNEPPAKVARKLSIGELKKVCPGITCNRRNKIWCLDQNFVQSRIEGGKLHCQRCSKLCTAMRQSAQMLETVGNNIHLNKEKLDSVQEYARQVPSNGIKYPLMMKMLEDCDLQLRTSPKAKINNKHKILDRHKLICRVIAQNFKTIPNSDFNPNTASNFKFVSNTIRKGLEESKSLAIESNNIVIEQNEEQSKSNPNIPIILPLKSNHKICSKLQREVLSSGRFISDDSITTSIEVLRTYSGQHKIFIANGLANVAISTWNITQGWQRFGRIFNSREAAFTKPDGCYIIPIYTEAHWHFVVVTKKSRFFEGWIIDSMGIGQIDTRIHTSIREAFILNRGRWIWHTPRSFKQIENECGPRTVHGIWEICKGVKDGISMEVCIDKACMKETTNDLYNPDQIRRKVANLMTTHTPQMISQRVTFVQSGTEAKAGRGVKRKRSKYNRKNIVVIDAE